MGSRSSFESSSLLSGSRPDVLLEQDEMTCRVKGDEACFCVSSIGLWVIQDAKDALYQQAQKTHNRRVGTTMRTRAEQRVGGEVRDGKETR